MRRYLLIISFPLLSLSYIFTGSNESSGFSIEAPIVTNINSGSSNIDIAYLTKNKSGSVELSKDLIIKLQKIQRKLFKGEIYYYQVNEDKNNKLSFFLIYNGQQIEIPDKDLLNFVSVEKPTDYAKLKSNFIFQFNDSEFKVNLSSIWDKINNESCKLVSSRGSTIICKEEISTISIQKLSLVFRLVIPRSITLFYNKEILKSDYLKTLPPVKPVTTKPATTVTINELPVHTVTNTPINSGKIGTNDSSSSLTSLKNGNNGAKPNEKNVSPFFFPGYWPFLSNISWIIFLVLSTLVLLIIIFFIILYLKNVLRKRLPSFFLPVFKTPAYATYKGEKISEFTEKFNITIFDLFRFNRIVIDHKNWIGLRKRITGYNYEKLDDNVKKAIKTGLQGKSLLIGYNINEILSNKGRQNEKDKNGDASFTEIVEKLNNLSNTVENIQSSLSNELKPDFITRLVDLSGDVKKINTEIKEVLKEKNNLSKNLVKADFLSGYAGLLIPFITFLEQTPSKAEKLIAKYKDKIEFSSENDITRKILLKYYKSIPISEIGKWRQICQEITDYEIVSDKDLIQRLSNDQDINKRKDRFIEKAYFSLLRVFISYTLILCEEMKNLNKFIQKTSFFVSEADTEFSSLPSEIIKKLRNQFNLQVNYIPLFSNKDNLTNEESRFTRPSEEKIDDIYLLIAGVKYNDILEIKSYGFEKINGYEIEETKVILYKS